MSVDNCMLWQDSARGDTRTVHWTVHLWHHHLWQAFANFASQNKVFCLVSLSPPARQVSVIKAEEKEQFAEPVGRRSSGSSIPGGSSSPSWHGWAPRSGPAAYRRHAGAAAAFLTGGPAKTRQRASRFAGGPAGSHNCVTRFTRLQSNWAMTSPRRCEGILLWVIPLSNQEEDKAPLSLAQPLILLPHSCTSLVPKRPLREHLRLIAILG